MKAESANLYAVLGLTPQATQAEVSHAYRVLLLQHHPDTRGTGHGDSDVAADGSLQEILAAYAVLRDPDRRAAYDRRTSTPRPDPRPAHSDVSWDPGMGARWPPIQVGPVRWEPSTPRPER